ncbi:unnamed protein product [Cunninghamella blakesleeana]
MSFLPRTPMKHQVFNLILPGITPNKTKVAEGLLTKNNRIHHIFFNEKKFHNHLTHHILAAYSLGANEEQLEKIYAEHASYQRPLPPLLNETFTRDNYLNHLGKAEAYTSYLRFFEKEIEEHGIINTVRRFVWSGDMLSRTLGGALHAIIHIGYGVEFSIPGQTAEGLALAACTSSDLSSMIGDLPPISTSLVPIHAYDILHDHHDEEKVEKKDTPTILEIVESIRNNKYFDDAVTSDDDLKLTKLLTQPHIHKVYDHVKQWIHDHRWDTRAAVNERLKELYTSIVLIYGASGFKVNDEHNQRVQLDFFLMHALTSSYFLHVFAPHIHINEASSLIQAHLLTTLLYYVAMGRPPIQLDRLLAYKSPTLFRDDQPHDWLHVLSSTLTEEDVHTVKAVRSIALADILYGNDPNGLGDAYIKASQLTIDLHGKWTFGVGFDE